MNIKVKLIITFIIISLVSLVISNSLLYLYEKQHAAEEVLNHLESVASIQRTRIAGLNQQNLERLGLVASRTQMRISLDKFNQSKKLQHQNKMNRIIADAKKSINDFKLILIIALDGTIVAATDETRLGQNIVNNAAFKSGKMSSRVDFFTLDSNQKLIVQFSGPLYLKKKLLGVLLIESAIDTMLLSIKDYTGLGETGETVLAKRTKNGDAVFIMPARFDKHAALKLRIKSTQKNIPIIHAVNGEERLFENSIDYRGEAVLSVTRYVKDAKWGLVVKIDKSEAFSYLDRMLNTVMVILFSCLLLVVVTTIYFSNLITRPIVELTETAKKIIDGDLLVQADVTSTDEIGLLGRTFNLMTASLNSEQNKLIQSKQQLASSEAMFRGVLESAVDGVLMVDHNGKILLANKSLSDMTGFTISEMIGELVEKLVPNSYRDHAQYRDVFFKNPKSRSMASGLSLHIKRKNGTVLPVEISLTPVVSDRGTVVTAIIQDVSVRLKNEQEKEDLLISLESKNAELERFTYTVSHDLKSPLVTISGFVGLLENDIRDFNKDRIASDIKQINDAAKTMQHLLNDLLELSRIGRQESTRVDVSVETLVHEVISLLTVSITACHAEITVEPNLPVIHVEHVRFKEVYLNLIENALKYRRDDVIPKINIGVRKDTGETNELVFFVKDNGLGIDAQYQKKIFDLFERLSIDKDGTGVGLAVVKRILEVHDGQVWVESDGQGNGSIFYFSLPKYSLK